MSAGPGSKPWQPPAQPLSSSAEAALERLRIKHGGVTPEEALRSLAATPVDPATDTVGDRNAAAKPYLDKVPDASLAHAMRSLHGLRDNLRHGKIETQEISSELAAKMHAAIQAALGRPDGFGDAHDLGKLGLGYASPAGSLIVKKPAKKGQPWTVSYTAQTEMAGGKKEKGKSTADDADGADGGANSDPSTPSAVKPPAPRRQPRPAEDTFDPSSFGAPAPPKQAATAPPSNSPFSQAIESAAADHELGPADLADAVNFVWQERRQFLADQEDAMRELIGHFDKNRGAFTRALKRAADPDEVPHFDEVLEAALNSGYAELFGGNRGGRSGLETRLFDFLKQGKRRPPARHDPEIVAEAVSLAKSAAAVYASPGSDDFARTGQVVRYCRWRVERYAVWREDDHSRNRWGEFAGKSAPDQGGSFGGSGAASKSEHHSAVLDRVANAVEEHVNDELLSPASAKVHRQTLVKLAERLSAAAMARIGQQVKAWRFHDSSAHLGAELGLRPGERLAGCFKAAGSDSPGDLHLSAFGHPSLTLAHAAHEIGHALDGIDSDISNDPEWIEAWQAEIRDLANIDEPAKHSPSEGFAEFCRLILTTDRSLSELEAVWPKTMKIWRKYVA